MSRLAVYMLVEVIVKPPIVPVTAERPTDALKVPVEMLLAESVPVASCVVVIVPAAI